MKNSFFAKITEPIVDLFWKTQVTILRNCPPLCGIVSDVSLGAAHSSHVWIRTVCKLLIKTPKALLLHLKNKHKKRAFLSRVSLSVTNRCTLNCDKCLGRVPDLKNKQDPPIESLLHDIKALFNGVDRVYALIITGGEALLRQDLDKIIMACVAENKVDKISIQTNGTIIPNDKTLDAIKRAEITVKISKYPYHLQPNVEKLKAILNEKGIAYTHESAEFWSDVGRFGEKQEGDEQKRFSICTQQLCLPYINGKLYLCASSAFLMQEGLIADCPEEYIDMHKVSNQCQVHKLFNKLIKKRVVSACSYCLGATYKTPKISIAEQREKIKETH